MPDRALARILIVDDETAQMKALCDTLRDAGYETVGCSTGEAAIAVLSEDGPAFDLLLTDLMMPGMDGITLLQTAQQIDRDLVAIIMTGEGTIVTAVEAMKAGALDYILKPFKLSLILPVLYRALGVRLLRIEKTELERRLSEHANKLERLVAERTIELNDANDQLRRAAQVQQAFLRDVLASVTDGGLILCHGVDELPQPLLAFCEPIDLSAETALRLLRVTTRSAAREAGFSDERIYDLVTAAHEAGMNSVVHVGAGTAHVSLRRGDGLVRVRVEDTGPGITLEQLPKATLQKGYTTAGTFGHGMKMMLYTVDRVFLLTGPDGTTVVLEQNRDAPDFNTDPRYLP
ncbi:MAG: two-component hybrid sensor and regulator [Capsulimonas sp.]|jgi:DNA-binding response OmpR family regulator/anti-sigma regulatory factor (Ser/Thr protein kinase)|nr:two-component hybrid sensor and regulator [Capsulimonas sp.]